MVDTPVAEEGPIAEVEASAANEPMAEEKPKTRRRPRARKADVEAPVEVATEAPSAAVESADVAEVVPAAPKRRSRAKKVVLPVDTDVAIELAVADASAPIMPVAASNDQAEDEAEGDADDGSGLRRGWWQRTFG